MDKDKEQKKENYHAYDVDQAMKHFNVPSTWNKPITCHKGNFTRTCYSYKECILFYSKTN